ncbi:hypothetical protein [Salinimicrobium xinjiangense]|uniref:hypothetical protein n=1 Tax=Salinimicrobium xinjiangense TaxID=438596 RepID=UPI0003F5910A|nr:hypothetical protein [Salinimicrobium xinjiangense]
MKQIKLSILLLMTVFFVGCGAYNEVTTFPPSDEVFITSGDGDIQKPYTPVGQLIYARSGYRLGLPILGLIPFNDVNPDRELREEVITEIKRQGGDGLINMQITFEAPKNGILGIGAKGGVLFVTGTIIKR